MIFFFIILDKTSFNLMANTTKNAVEKHHIESDPLVIDDSFEGYPLHFFK
jgi:hypothetical protein